jgi:hypothetical protein
MVKSQSIRPSKAGMPQNRKPSPPLFGMPVVVGVSDAVIATRNVCAQAGGVAASARSAANTDRLARGIGHLQCNSIRS